MDAQGMTYQDTQSHLELILITGLSGAGKSTALHVFEDLGYFPMDGLPLSLLPHMSDMLRHNSMHKFKGIALGVSVHHAFSPTSVNVNIHDASSQERAQESAKENAGEGVGEILDALRAQHIHPCLVFFEADEAEILRRYTTTRRPHPLERAGFSLLQALEREKHKLAPLRHAASFIFDTTPFSIHDLRRVLQQQWGQAEGTALRTLKVNLISFGFKYATPKDADMLFDVRFLPNPYFDISLRHLSGQSKAIVDYIFAQTQEQSFLKKLTEFVLFTLPLMESEGRYRITIAVGCTGGRHRSVATAEHLSKAIQQAGYTTALEHRHMALADKVT